MTADLSLESSMSYEHYYLHKEDMVIYIYDCIGEIPNYGVYEGRERILEMIEDIIEYLQEGQYTIINMWGDLPDTDDTKGLRKYLSDIFIIK